MSEKRKRGRLIPYGILRMGDPPQVEMQMESEDDHLRDFDVPLSVDKWRTARALLDKFVAEGASSSPVLVAYIAERIGDWLATDCSKEGAQAAFRVKRPEHREPSWEIEEKQVRAIEIYLTSRGQGLNRKDALGEAASSQHMSIKTVEPFLGGLHDPRKEFTELQIVAIRHIQWDVWAASVPGYSRPVQDPDFLKRCLGRGWEKWEAYLRAQEKLFAGVRQR